MRIFGHPARNRYDNLPKNYTPFVYRDARPKKMIGPDNYTHIDDDEDLQGLIWEVEANGYGDDLVTDDQDSAIM